MAYVSLDDLYVRNYKHHGIVKMDPSMYFGMAPIQQKEETQMAMKKYFTHSGSGTRYDTQDEATTAAKKYLDSMSKNYGTNNDIYVLEAVACVTFPIPSYEVVALAAKA